MRNEKCLSLAAALIIAVFFISLGGVQASSFSSGLIATSPYTSGSTSSVSSLFSSSQCKAGQDFVLQVSPTGCTPSVIRSDLLEEQNVPVFCPIVATKINPLIDVNAINNVIISGATSSEVSGTDFLPNRAALKSSVRSQITSPVLGSIGYAVIVLKQQAESELANCESTVFGDVCWVEGTLTAKLNYDIQNAFGIGQSTFYLPATSDAEWNQNYKKYSFWNGRGYLRAESIESDGATISVYSGSNSRNSETTRTASVGIPVGGTSQDISIPGFDFCLGTMKLKLNGLENPDTTATFDINGNPAEVKVGESFLNNRCTVKSIDKQGINQKVSVRCNEDDGSNPLNFVSSPKIKLNIDGVNRTVSAGDWVYNTDDSKSVYVAYVRTKGDTNSEQDLSVSLAAIPTEVGKTKLTDSELNSFARFMATFPDKDVDSIMSFGTTVYKIYASGLESLYRGWVIGQDFKDVGYSDSAGKVLFKKTIKVVGFADPVNVDLSILSANAQTDYENALKDYQKVLDDYTSEKYPSDDQKTLGQRALENLIKLDDAVSQKRNVVEFCAQFKESFSNVKIPEECVNAVELSNSDFGTRDVLVGGRVYRMTLTNIREPTSTEFGAQISVKKPDGEVVTPTLKKNQIVYLDSKILYSYDAGILSSAVYYRYQENKWQWSEDQKTWADTSSSSASSSGQSNVVNKLANSGLDAGVNHLKGLKAKDLSSDVYVQLLDISKDSSGENVVRIATNLREGVVDAIGNILVGQETTVTLKQNFPITRQGYTFLLQQANLEQVAKVSIIPNIDYASSTADFPFKIGIEKRSIQLSPEKTRDRITSLNETIEKFNRINDKIGTAVEIGNKMCLAAGLWFTYKSFAATLSGEGMARKAVMDGPQGYFALCDAEIKNSGSENFGKSKEACLLAKNDAIENSVKAYADVVKAQDKNMKNLQENILTTKILGESSVDTTALLKKYVDDKDYDYKGKLQSSLSGAGISTIKVGNKDVFVLDIVDQISSNTTFLTQARDLELNAQLLKSEDSVVSSIARGKVESTLNDIWVKVEKNVAARNFQNQATAIPGLESIGVGAYAVANSIKAEYTGGKTTAAVGDILKDVPLQGILYGNIQYYVELKVVGSNYQVISVYDEKRNLVATQDTTRTVNSAPTDAKTIEGAKEILSRFVFNSYDSSTYNNPYPTGTARIQYFESGNYAGFPAIVPFDLQHGWYAAVKPTLPIGSSRKAYEASGRISSYWLCNIGPNQKQEPSFYGTSDDTCVMIDTSINAPYGAITGLDTKEGEGARLASIAVRAIAEASDAHTAGVENVRITPPSGSQPAIEVGPPAIGVPDIQCQDFMSPVDCNLLFNVCDPVICPTSRCDLGGNYHVADVVQSGVLGSIALCLPNWPEVKVPVCLSGIHAGLDSYISVLDNYQSCLQNSLETGQQIGICDELHSVYMCQFLWDQGLPIANAVGPTLVGKVLGKDSARGGGEYLGMQQAWQAAKDSANYFTQNYAVQSYQAFKARSTAGVGTAFCQNWISLRAPDGGSLLDSITKPRVPTQFYGRFDEIPYTTATVPPTSQYKVFYHIYAGDTPASYQVYMKGTSQAFFQDTSSRRVVASDFIAAENYASESIDFIAPSGYTQLCISVNNQEECGFKQVSTDYAVTYIADQYAASEAARTDITSSGNCVSGTPNMLGLINPNLQAGATSALNPEIYNMGITRICSTGNPGSATDEEPEKNPRWVPVGYCDTTNIGCWLDTKSIKTAIKNTGTADSVTESTTSSFLETLKKERGFLSDEDFSAHAQEIMVQEDALKQINLVNEIFPNVFEKNKKGFLTLLRGDAYGSLVSTAFAAMVKTDDKAAAAPSGDSAGGDGAEVEAVAAINKIDSGETGATNSAKRIQAAQEAAEARAEVIKEGGNNYPVIQFRDGNAIIGSQDPYFMFSDINGENKWTWSLDKKAFYTYSDLSPTIRVTPGLKLKSKNTEFIKNIDSYDYLNGVIALFVRVRNNDEGGWFGNPEISTESVTLYDDGKFQLQVTGSAVVPPQLVPIFFQFSLWDNYDTEPDPDKWQSDNKWQWDYALDEASWKNVSSSDSIDLARALFGKNLGDGTALIFSLDSKNPLVVPSSTSSAASGTTSPTSVSVGSCETQEDCQKILGAEIVKIASSFKAVQIKSVPALADALADEVIKRDTGLPNFECLVLAVAYQESKIQHCGLEIGTRFMENGNPLYCDGNVGTILYGDEGKSLGVMQVNKDHHGVRSGFVDNANTGVAILTKGYNSESKSYSCSKQSPGNTLWNDGTDFVSVSYEGWERALRNYNGWNDGCTYVKDGKTVIRGDPNYVENVLDPNSVNTLKSLFSEICG